ncbi:hypothetical protein CPB84DRAFT_1736607 [Gymnopilus junonius]|uniref:Mtf2-like C-terminal domain-containing protein n=1 Tax=Gymnopilus junonius TaxID=109634 RepID=A0A9P5TH67_GYMJU|nr:hypothetical protein CPB84DRAFT_1736607 [Gymnopilus junonius]
MTERESKVLTGMLDMIFESKETQEGINSDQSKDSSSDESGGIVRGQVDDLFSRLRRFSRRPRKEIDSSTQLFDQKKEGMSFCATDQQLLEWAMREVFDESKRYEEAARKAMTTASTTGTKTELPHLQSPIYSQLIAHLMRTFRVHFRDPNLALFIFNHAQKLSTVSYVFGCSTAAYNELVETRWLAFSDLDGVRVAIEEMNVNGVPFDSRTRKVIDTIRRELGSKEILTGYGEEVQSESWETLAKIEKLLAPKLQTKRRSFVQWKAEVAEVDEDETFDNWSFGDLEKIGNGRSARSTE